MGFLSGLALVMLTLVGYAAGATLSARQRPATPALLDLAVVLGLWILALGVRDDLGRWLSVLVWFVTAGLVSAGLTAVRPSAGSGTDPAALPPDLSMARRTWIRWRAFAAKIGNYQGRLLMTLFYFLIVTPFGLPFRLLSDPLDLRRPPKTTGWRNRPEPQTTIEEARSQF